VAALFKKKIKGKKKKEEEGNQKGRMNCLFFLFLSVAFLLSGCLFQFWPCHVLVSVIVIVIVVVVVAVVCQG
jgi:hypothetical protein